MEQLDNLRILIIGTEGWVKGGEAPIAQHYFKQLRIKGIEAWLILYGPDYARMISDFSADKDRIYFVKRTIMHKFLSSMRRILPSRLRYFSITLIQIMLYQIQQRNMARTLIKKHNISLVHQPVPVSPRMPSFIYGLNVPIIMGPLNGGMNYPPAFRHHENLLEKYGISIGRFLSNLCNRIIPGKLSASVVIVANDRTERALPSGVRGNIVKLVENGVDLSLWSPRETSHSSEQRPVAFVYVGRLVALKGVNYLLEAFSVVSKRVKARLTIIGDGPQRNYLENISSDLDLAPLVSFTGWLSQRDCADHLKKGDVFVLPSLLECGGAVVLEAMASGLPIVATNWGGPADYVDENSGILIEPASPEAFVKGMADAMLRLAISRELRIRMGREGRKKAEEQFDWEKKTNQMISIYLNVA